MERGVLRTFIKLLFCWYNKYTVVVKWGSIFSRSFSLTAGVRQGSVLSPHLFAIYINGIIEIASDSKAGLCISNVFLGCIVYADDILLITNSVYQMQYLI